MYIASICVCKWLVDACANTYFEWTQNVQTKDFIIQGVMG